MSEILRVKYGESLMDTPDRKTASRKEIIEEHGRNWKWLGKSTKDIVPISPDGVSRVGGYASRTLFFAIIEPDDARSDPFPKPGVYAKE